MWTATLSVTAAAAAAAAAAPLALQHFLIEEVDTAANCIRILTPTRTHALHCHPTGHHNRDKIGHTPTICWTDIMPQDGRHAIWRRDTVEGGVTLRWHPLGDDWHYPEYRGWALYLSIDDTGALVPSVTPHVWKIL
jgi:hypothetical protein